MNEREIMRLIERIVERPYNRGTVTKGAKILTDFLAACRSEWQPIETAPKEWNSPSVLISDGDDVEEAYWSGEDWIAGDARSAIEPTHWMLLPEPPKKG